MGLFLCTIEYYKREEGGGGEGCVPDRIAIWNCWNENIGGRNALDLLYLKTSLWTLIYGGATPKQPNITRQTLKDISNKSVLCFSYPDLW